MRQIQTTNRRKWKSSRTIRTVLILFLTWCMVAPLGAAQIQVNMFADIPEFRDLTGDRDSADTSVRSEVRISDSQTSPEGVAYSYQAFANDRGQFGGFAQLSANDYLAKFREMVVGGKWSAWYTREANTTSIPFRISNTRLYVSGGIAKETRYFFTLHMNPADGSLSNFHLQDDATIDVVDGVFNVEIPPDVLTGTYNDGEYIFDPYLGSIDVSHIPVGDTFELDYRWQVEAFVGDAHGVAFASFYDPIGDGGGFSFDMAGFTEVPAPVPVPAAFWLFGSGLGFLVWMKRKR